MRKKTKAPILLEKNTKEPPIDVSRRQFLLTTTGVLGGIGMICALKPLTASLMPSTDALAEGAPVSVDLSALTDGQQLTVLWRGKPVWIIKRTQEMLQTLNKDQASLRDPDSLVFQQPPYAKNNYRSINPTYLVLIGICTHLGCSPQYKPKAEANWLGGFYCPCHGSTFDLAGRVFKGVPAPINLEVPPYRFINDHMIVIGEEGGPHE